MTRDEWKEQSLPVGVRMIELRDKAEDQGLTETEQVELVVIERMWRELFEKFLLTEFPRRQTKKSDPGMSEFQQGLRSRRRRGFY